jgi:hypothetical protein
MEKNEMERKSVERERNTRARNSITELRSSGARVTQLQLQNGTCGSIYSTEGDGTISM